MEEALQMHGGAIEKIIGDAVTAAFYEDTPGENHARRACKAAKEMKARLQKFNQQREQIGRFSIRNGIGIATGEAVLGFASGGSGRREFVLIGDVTHRAAALEARTRRAKTTGIFIDLTTAELAAERFEEVRSDDQDNEIIGLELLDG